MDIHKLKGKKIVIYGAGQIGQIAIPALKEVVRDYESELIGCAVTSSVRNLQWLDGLEVHDIDYWVNRDKSLFYLIAVREQYNDQIVRELSKREIENYDFFDCKNCIEQLEKMWENQGKERYLDFKEHMDRTMLTDEDYVLFLSKQLKCGVLNFEYNLADHCNLNCQCCNHFSPIAEKVFLSCGQLEKDLKRLETLLGNKNVGKVMLLGGEPLLHPEINEILRISRECLPNATLDIITNGLMLPKMKNTFWKSMKDSQVNLKVTKYPINFDYEYCEELAKEHGIMLSYGVVPEPVKTTYHLPINDNAVFNPYQMYMKCYHANQCVVLREGRLYTCPLAANVHHYNKYYGKHIPAGEDVSIDLHNATDWKEIEEFLKRPNKMCSHCDIYHYTYDIPWAVSKRDIKEWT